MKRKRGYRRGYPVAILVGLEERNAVLWQVFSMVVKPYATLRLGGMRADKKALYSFHEAIVDALRPSFKEGVRSVLIATPSKTNYSQDFLDHVQRHHAWLVHTKGNNAVTIGELSGSASKPNEVADLVKTKRFRDLIGETTSEDADHVIDTLEKRLGDLSQGSTALYSLREVEDLIYHLETNSRLRPEYLVLTNEYLNNHKERSRINRLLQVSGNKNIRTVIVEADTPAGKRLTQFGGLICLAVSTRTDSH